MTASEISLGAEAEMAKKRKGPVRNGAAQSKAITNLASHVEREVQRRLGPKATFEQRNDMSAQVMQEVLFKRSDDDLRGMVADDEEEVVDDDEDARYRRLDQPSSATYFGRWGSHYIEEPLYRKVGERNGPTIKPIELRAGIVEHMTPDLARLVGELGADRSSRDVERTLRSTGQIPPSRAFLEKRFGAMASDIAKNVENIETAVRKMEAIPADVVSMSCGLDRFSVRMNEPLEGDAANEAPRPLRSEPYQRTAPPPKETNWRKAWVGTASIYDKAGDELATWKYAMPADADADKLAERVAADVLRLVAVNPRVVVHCIQDEAPELSAMPEALARMLPANVKPRALTDFEHLMGYLEEVVDACEPEGDQHDWKGWYRGELLRDDGAIDRIWRKLRGMAERLAGKGTKARDAVAAALSYIRRRKNKMRYATHYAAKLPIGSGATESACWLMQRRVKQPGQAWAPGLGGVLAVRAFVHSERWPAAWDMYAARHRHELRCAA